MFSYRYQNSLGSTYRGGSLQFTSDGNCLLNPVGNRTQILDLKQNRSLCLAPENRKDISLLALSPDNRLLLSVDVDGHSLLVNFAKATILHRLNFRTKVRDAVWSPDSQWLAVTHGRLLQLWRAPAVETGWQFEKYRTLGGHREDIRRITWSQDSLYLLTCGDDMQVRLYSVLDHEEAGNGRAALEGTVEQQTVDPSGKRNTKSKKRGAAADIKSATAAGEDDHADATTKRLGRLGKLTGEKSTRSYGGFKPVLFAELRQPVRGSYFSQNKEYVFCICKDGVVATWRFQKDEKAAAVESESGHGRARISGAVDAVEDFDWNKHEKNDGEEDGTTTKQPAQEKDLLLQPGTWTCASKVFMNLPAGQKITDSDFNVRTNVALVGLTGGVFSLYELLPTVSVLHTLSIGQSPIDHVRLNNTGEWVAVGSSAAGQMLVWEWQSETYILKQQGHHWGVNCCAFAPSGGLRNAGGKQQSGATAEGQGNNLCNLHQAVLATGGHDGKVKLWNTVSGFNFVTFAEHTGEVRDLVFTPQANAVISASVDGTVRAFDLLRYRNFRTFVSPPKEKKVFGFESVAVDGGGEIVAAAAKGDVYSVLVWSLQTGQLLDTISGNEAPVSCLSFSPNPAKPGELATGCWDGHLTVSDIFKRARGSSPEKLQCGASVLALAFDPRGNNMIACSQLAGQIIFWDTEFGQIRGTVEGIRDICSGRDAKGGLSAANDRGKKSKKDKYKYSLEHVNLNQHFGSIAYTASGSLLLASSRNSPHVCLYSTTAFELVHRYTLTNNQSLSGLKVLLNAGKTVVDGETLAEYDLSDSEQDDYERKRRRVRDNAALPGVKVGDSAKAYEESQFHCWGCDFSLDGKNFAVATSHGLMLYAIDSGVSATDGFQSYGTALESFQPAVLTENVSIPNILKALQEHEKEVRGCWAREESGDEEEEPRDEVVGTTPALQSSSSTSRSSSSSSTRGGPLEVRRSGSSHLTKAFILSLALNDARILLEVYERIPIEEISLMCQSIGASLLPTLIHFLTCMLHPSWGSTSIEKHVVWLETLLTTHISTFLQWTGGHRGNEIQQKQHQDPILLNAKVQVGEIQALLLQCLQQLSGKYSKLQSVFEKNKHMLTYLSTSGRYDKDLNSCAAPQVDEDAEQRTDHVAQV
ncbi:unnamed protein product [Amoebophrya sp. A120]|nr:unnamed protein product [Amoebophrya sp. A120]|eukprot:GSA120T00023730001.1